MHFTYHSISPSIPFYRTFNLFSMSIYLPALTYHVSRVMQYVAFCDWFLSPCMFSSFVYLVACNNTSSLFIAECYSIMWIEHILFINQFMDTLTVMTNAIVNPMHRFMCEHMFLIVFGIYLGKELWVIW